MEFNLRIFCGRIKSIYQAPQVWLIALALLARSRCLQIMWARWNRELSCLLTQKTPNIQQLRLSSKKVFRKLQIVVVIHSNPYWWMPWSNRFEEVVLLIATVFCYPISNPAKSHTKHPRESLERPHTPFPHSTRRFYLLQLCYNHSPWFLTTSSWYKPQACWFPTPAGKDRHPFHKLCWIALCPTPTQHFRIFSHEFHIPWMH